MGTDGDGDLEGAAGQVRRGEHEDIGSSDTLAATTDPPSPEPREDQPATEPSRSDSEGADPAGSRGEFGCPHEPPAAAAFNSSGSLQGELSASTDPTVADEGKPADGESGSQEPAHEENSLLPVLTRLAALESDLAAFRAAFDERLRTDRFREEQVAKLHGELQNYKTDFVGALLEPVLGTLVNLHIEASRLIEALQVDADASISKRDAAELLDSFREDVRSTLQVQGVSVFQDRETGDTFNPRRQQVLNSIATDDVTRHGLIARRVRPGFERGSSLLQKERVDIYVSPTVKS